MRWQSLGLPSQGGSLTPGGLGLPRSPSNSTTPTFLCCSLSCSGSEGRELSESLSLGSGRPEFLATRESHYHDSRPRWALSLSPGVAWELEIPNEQQRSWELQPGWGTGIMAVPSRSFNPWPRHCHLHSPFRKSLTHSSL